MDQHSKRVFVDVGFFVFWIAVARTVRPHKSLHRWANLEENRMDEHWTCEETGLSGPLLDALNEGE